MRPDSFTMLEMVKEELCKWDGMRLEIENIEMDSGRLMQRIKVAETGELAACVIINSHDNGVAKIIYPQLMLN